MKRPVLRARFIFTSGLEGEYSGSRQDHTVSCVTTKPLHLPLLKLLSLNAGILYPPTVTDMSTMTRAWSSHDGADEY